LPPPQERQQEYEYVEPKLPEQPPPQQMQEEEPSPAAPDVEDAALSAPALADGEFEASVAEMDHVVEEAPAVEIPSDEWWKSCPPPPGAPPPPPPTPPPPPPAFEQQAPRIEEVQAEAPTVPEAEDGEAAAPEQ